MTKETMREKFEESYLRDRQRISRKYSMPDGIFLTDGDYLHRETQAAWNSYQQGQRDLIEAMGEPVAYIHHHKGGDNLEWDSPGVNYSPLYRLPEDTQR